MFCTKGNQCCAITLDNKRCQNLVIKSSKHCSSHYNNALKLYKNYKKICDVAYNLDVDKHINDPNEKAKYLLKYYVLMNKAYDARMKHRKYAFVPECYDLGHDKQFKLINDKINLCEEKLYELYQEYNFNKIKYNSDIVESDDESESGND